MDQECDNGFMEGEYLICSAIQPLQSETPIVYYLMLNRNDSYN